MCEQVVENINLAKILGVVFQEKRLFFRRITKISAISRIRTTYEVHNMNNLHERVFKNFKRA